MKDIFGRNIFDSDRRTHASNVNQWLFDHRHVDFRLEDIKEAFPDNKLTQIEGHIWKLKDDGYLLKQNDVYRVNVAKLHEELDRTE